VDTYRLIIAVIIQEIVIDFCDSRFFKKLNKFSRWTNAVKSSGDVRP